MDMILRICQGVGDEAVKGGEGARKRGKAAAAAAAGAPSGETRAKISRAAAQARLAQLRATFAPTNVCPAALYH